MSNSSIWARRRAVAKRIDREVEGLHPISPGAYMYRAKMYDTAAEVRRAVKADRKRERMERDEAT